MNQMDKDDETVFCAGIELSNAVDLFLRCARNQRVMAVPSIMDQESVDRMRTASENMMHLRLDRIQKARADA